MESLTAVLGESNGISELSVMPIAQQLSSETRFNVVPAHCCGRRWLHQSIIIFAYAASCCLENAFVMNRPQLHRSVSEYARLNDHLQKLPIRARQAAQSLFLRDVSRALVGAVTCRQ